MNETYYTRRMAEKDAEIERALDRIRLLKEQRAELDRLLDERTLERRGICPRCRYHLTPDSELSDLRKRITRLEEQRDALIEEQVLPPAVPQEIAQALVELAKGLEVAGRNAELYAPGGGPNPTYSEARARVQYMQHHLDTVRKWLGVA